MPFTKSRNPSHRQITGKRRFSKTGPLCLYYQGQDGPSHVGSVTGTAKVAVWAPEGVAIVTKEAII